MGPKIRFSIGWVMLAVAACAGKSVRDGNNGDTGGGPSSGGSGAASTGGSAGSATGGSGGTDSSGGSGGAAGGGPRGACLLPPDSGPCDAAMRRYAFDAETDLCLPFVYGGCEGNANNFASATECYQRCDDQGARGPSACNTSADCTATATDCCGCAPPAWQTMVGVNWGRTNQIANTKCATVDCDACPVSSDSAWFSATCEEGHCVAYDVRETSATDCATDADCHLRNGLGCCEACEPNATTLVSLNDDSFRTLCPTGPPPCPPCVEGGPRYPTDAHPLCQSGKCGIIWELH